MPSRRTQLARLAEQVAHELIDVQDRDERTLLRDAFDNGVDEELRYLEAVAGALNETMRVLDPAQGDRRLAAAVGLKAVR